MPVPTVKIADFCNMLQELTEKSTYGYKDIHTLNPPIQRGVNICASEKGILYDSHDLYHQVVQEATRKTADITISKYYGNNEDSHNKKLDSYITVKLRDQDKADIHIDVEVGGNGRKALFQIRNGECKFCAILPHKE